MLGIIRWLGNKIASHWDLLSTVAAWLWTLAGAVVTGWAARAAGIFQEYAPLSWVLAGFFGAAISAAIYFSLAGGRWLWQITSLRKRIVADTNRVNPLRPVFQHERISVADLAPPFGNNVENKTFLDCELVGPGMVAIVSDCQVTGAKGLANDGVVGRPEAVSHNAIFFRRCTFRDCSFYRLTFVIPETLYDSFNRALPGANWITRVPETQPQLELAEAKTGGNDA